MLRSNLISLCGKLRSNTSLIKHSSNDQSSQNSRETSVIVQTIEHFKHQRLLLNYKRKIFIGNYLLKVNLDYFSGGIDRLARISKMKDLLLTTKLAENDILISEQRNNYTNGISNGR